MNPPFVGGPQILVSPQLAGSLGRYTETAPLLAAPIAVAIHSYGVAACSAWPRLPLTSARFRNAALLGRHAIAVAVGSLQEANPPVPSNNRSLFLAFVFRTV